QRVPRAKNSPFCLHKNRLRFGCDFFLSQTCHPLRCQIVSVHGFNQSAFETEAGGAFSAKASCIGRVSSGKRNSTPSSAFTGESPASPAHCRRRNHSRPKPHVWAVSDREKDFAAAG